MNGSPPDHQNSILKIPFLRRFHWGIILLCSFLPAVESCDKKIIIPYQDFLKLDNWVQSSIYIYPVVLVFLTWLVFSVVKPAWRFRVSWSIGYIFFLFLSCLVYVTFQEMPEWYYALLIGIWGMIAFGLLRCRNEHRVMDLTGFLLTALALWLFPFAFVFREKILYGGWLYLYATVFIILTYVFQFFNGLRAVKAGNYQGHDRNAN